MAKSNSLVMSHLERLDSLLLQEKKAFHGVEDQMGKIVNKLKEIGLSFDDDPNELIGVINDIENHVDKFLSHADEADRTTLTDCFRSDMEKIEARLEETARRKSIELKSSHGVIEEGETSSSSTVLLCESEFANLPECVRDCLMYCSIFPENYSIHKGKLVRLLVAEGLIEEKEGKVMEDTAEEGVSELVNKGMLKVNEQHSGNGTKLQVPSCYRELCLGKIEEGKFKASHTVPHRARRVVASLDELKDDTPQLWSLFLIGDETLFGEKSDWLKLDSARFLRVLDLERAKINGLPDEVGDMTQLRYLCLKQTDITELPESLFNLTSLLTLDIRYCGHIESLPSSVLRLVSLRHLKMFKNYGVRGVKIPLGIARLKSLLTLTGIDPSDGIARELGYLTQLRRLGVMDVSEENANELFSSIMKMDELLSLSLEPKCIHHPEKLILLNSFSPPLTLRKLRLEGVLEKVPTWLGSLESLTNLRLGFSHLSDNPALVLQGLPNLKNLTLWNAYDGKQMGREFCRAGGFPKLEVLTIASKALEEWTQLEEGALPSLRHLRLHNCMRLRMLPEGLQFVTTLEEMYLLPMLDELEERLKPDGGQENYKIRHIPRIRFMTTSMIHEIFKRDMREANEEI